MAGAGLSMALVPLFFQLANSDITALPLLFLTHALIFAGVGAAAGAALGWEWGDRKVIVRCMLGGVVGAVVATLVGEVVNVAAFGIMRIFEPVPATSMARILVHLWVALGATMGLYWRVENSVPGNPEKRKQIVPVQFVRLTN